MSGPLSRLNLPGAVLATCGLAAIAYGFARATSRGWSAPVTLAALVAGVGLLVGFVVVQARWAVVPLIPLRLFRIRSVAVGNVAVLLAGACLNPMWFFLTLSMQNVLGYSPIQTGLAFLPHTLITIAIGTQVTPTLMRLVDGRVLVAVWGAAGRGRTLLAGSARCRQ
ncbi:hypothetical protein [Nocardia sp. NPDC057455]|uniref:hypothetical protein n=1 Tax=Nocardia sp. NPDC057455 TaxID=3346138 RepID=UPI00366EC491